MCWAERDHALSVFATVLVGWCFTPSSLEWHGILIQLFHVRVAAGLSLSQAQSILVLNSEAANYLPHGPFPVSFLPLSFLPSFLLHSSHALAQLSLPLRTLQLKPTHSVLQSFLLLPRSLHFQRFRIVPLLPTMSEIQFRVLSSL